MATTRIPDVVDRLNEIARAALPAVQVLDGPHIGEVMDEAFVVGLSRPEGAGYRTSRERMDGAGRRPRLRELFTVRCMYSVVSGAVEVKPLRDRAGAALAAFDEALRDAARGGPWDTAPTITDTEWVPVEDQQGAAVMVLFDVEGSCYL